MPALHMHLNVITLKILILKIILFKFNKCICYSKFFFPGYVFLVCTMYLGVEFFHALLY